MPSLDDLKKRIKSVKSTQKITKAMKMVAAAKLRKAQESAEKGRPYSNKMQNIILNLTKSINNPENAPKLLVGTGNDQIYLCVVLTADRGLCGGFNSNICKLAKNHFKKLLSEGKKIKIIAGKFSDAEGPVKGHNVEPIYFDIELEKDKEFNFDLPSTHNSFIYLIEGEIKIGDKDHDKVNGSTLILLTKGEKLKVKGITKSKFLLISGKPIGEPIARGGPFVMNTKQEILQAVEDYHSGNFVQK